MGGIGSGVALAREKSVFRFAGACRDKSGRFVVEMITETPIACFNARAVLCSPNVVPGPFTAENGPCPGGISANVAIAIKTITSKHTVLRRLTLKVST